MHFGIGKICTWCDTGAVKHTKHSTSRQARHVKCDRRDMRLNLLCKVYEVMITVIFLLFNVSYLLIY